MRGSIILAAFVLGGAAVPVSAQYDGWKWQAAKPGKPIELPSGTPLPAGSFTRIGRDDGSHVRKAVIPYFQVQFVTASKKSSSRSWATLSQSYALAGITPADMQAMTDELYDKFVALLTAKGVAVMPIDQARASSPALLKLLAAAKPAPFNGKTGDGTVSTITTAKGLPIYFHTNDPERGSMANIGSRAYWDQPAAAKELGAALIGVRLEVNFVEQKNNDKRGLFGYRPQRAKVEGAVGLTVEPISTHLWIAGPTRQAGIIGQPVEPSRYYLESPVVLPAGSILDVEDATTAAQKRSDVINSALGTLVSGWMEQKNKAYVVTVDPGAFRRDVGGGLEAVEQAMAAQAIASIDAAK